MKHPSSFSLASAAFGALTLSFIFSLSACGKHSSSSKDDNKGPDGITEYETMDDLVHCTKSHFGEVAYVSETDSIYECTSEGWVAADSSKIEEILASSDSKDDSDDKSSDSKEDAKSSSSEKVSAEDTTKVEVVKIDSAKVLGYAQKGPFASGASVTVYGLDSNFAQTKTKFSGKVGADSGAFSVNGIVLSSQYAEVEVNGFYMNAVTGKNTSGTKTKLSALVDLSEGKAVKANVNLFSEFEKARALELVKKEKYNVPAAKMRASREILNVFGKNFATSKIDSASVPAATSMSLFDTSAVGNALYAAGVMMTLNLSVSKSANLISDVKDDIAANGDWSNDTTRATVADNLCTQDSADGFAAIRANLKEMKLAAAVPDFEANLRYFWFQEYGLGECTEKLEADETVSKVTNKQSDNYGAGFACTSKRWHKVTSLDTELGMCTSKMEGQYKESKLNENKKNPYFVCKQGTWTNISEVQYNLKECTAEKASVVDSAYKAVKDSFFVCKDLQWTALTKALYELKNCTSEKEGKKTAEADGKDYVCRNGEWREATAQESKFGVCFKATKEIESMDGKYYACLDAGWTEVGEDVGENGFCTEDKKNTLGKDAKGDNAYVCDVEKDSYAWREATAQESEFGVCLENSEKPKQSANGKYYACIDGAWSEADDKDGKNGYCTKEKVNTFGQDKDGKNAYVCDVKDGVYAWRDATALEKEFGLCLTAGGDPKKSEDGKHYACTEDGWKESSEVDGINGYCTSAKKNTLGKNEKNELVYMCDGSAWRDTLDYEVRVKKICEVDKDTVSVDEADVISYFACDGSKWSYVKDPIGALGVCDKAAYTKGTKGIFNGAKWICESNGWTTTEDENTYTAGLLCNASRLNSVNNGMACQNTSSTYNWRTATETEIAADSVCTSAAQYSVVNNYTCTYASSKYQWKASTEAEIANSSACYSGYAHINEVMNGYVCMNKGTTSSPDWGWRAATTAEKTTKKVCAAEIKNTVDGAYTCEYSSYSDVTFSSYNWRDATDAEKATKKVNCSPYEIINGYACVAESYSKTFAWRVATAGEKAVGVVCGCDNTKYATTCPADNKNVVKNKYACESTRKKTSDGVYLWAWRTATTMENNAGYICGYAKSGEVVNGYACDGSVWRTATALEKETKKTCYERIKDYRYVSKSDTSKVYDCLSSSSSYGWVVRSEGYTSTYTKTTDGFNMVINTRVISGVEWMIENVYFNNNESNYIVQEKNSWCGGSDSYNSSSTYSCTNYGRSYAYLDSDGDNTTSSRTAVGSACPSGWRLPTLLETKRLKNKLGSDVSPFIYDKYSYAGYRKEKGSYLETNEILYFWTSEAASSGYKHYGANIQKSSGSFGITTYDDSFGFSVRCVRDYRVLD